MAWLQAANPGTAAYLLLTVANASLLARYGTEEQARLWVGPMLEGRFLGTMCLSEPDAGSSLADITTRAEPQADGSYRVTGTKMWISGGDHELSENIVHLVLAKTPEGGPGVKSISLFAVPKFLADARRNDVTLAEAAGHVTVAWMWLEQLLAAHGKEGSFYDGKRQAGLYFFRHELPKTAAQFDLLAALDATTLDAQPDWF